MYYKHDFFYIKKGLQEGLVDGKKWVKFVSMQWNSATYNCSLISDLNTAQGTVES